MPLCHTGTTERISATFLPDSWFKLLRTAVVNAVDELVP
jgi:hypothetical protein